MNACLQYVKAIYGELLGHGFGCSLFWLDSKESQIYCSVERVVEAVKTRPRNVLIQMGAVREGLRLAPRTRPKQADVVALSTLWMDFDIRTSAKNQNTLPESLDQVCTFLESLPLRASMTVRSGTGIHAYWLLKEPISLRPGDMRGNAKRLSEGWQAYINERALDHGWTFDKTHDLNRLLRPPESVNTKGGDRLVEQLCTTGLRYALDEFEELIVPHARVESVDCRPSEIRGATITPGLRTHKSVLEGALRNSASFRQVWEGSRRDALDSSRSATDLSLATHFALFGADIQQIVDAICAWREKNGESINDRKSYLVRTAQKALASAKETAAIGPKHALEAPRAFPTSLLPEPLCEFVAQTAAATQCPDDFVGSLLLGALSIAIGSSFRLRLKRDWTEGASIYIAVVAEPGRGKSPALSRVRKFLDQRAKLLADTYEQELEEFRSHKSVSPDGAVAPVAKRVYAVDATIEAVTKLLSENPRGLGLVLDELSALIAGFGQYKSGRGSDRQHYLSAWAGQPLHVDRKGTGHLAIHSPSLTIMGGIQPDVLKVFNSKRVGNDGLLDRFLLSWPTASIPTAWCEEEVSLGLNDLVSQLVERLFRYGEADELFKSSAPVVATFNPDARRQFISWYEQTQTQMIDLTPRLAGVWAKMPSQAARLSLIVHAVEVASSISEQEIVSQTAVRAGIALADYFKDHAQRIHSHMAEEAKDRELSRLVEWMRRKGLDRVTVREVQRAKLAGTADDCRRLLRRAEIHGFGQFSSGTLLLKPGNPLKSTADKVDNR